MASGLPVFATEHGGIPEAIEHGKSGILVQESDDEALARVLLEAVAHPDHLTVMARNGADSVREKFEQRTQTRQLEDFYLETIASSETRLN